MKSKLIAIMIKAVIDLRLLTGYKLVPLDDWISLNVQLSENQTNTKQVDELKDASQNLMNSFNYIIF